MLREPFYKLIFSFPRTCCTAGRCSILSFIAVKFLSSCIGYSTTLSALASSGPGHWIQRERASIVNELLLGFLSGLQAGRNLTCRRRGFHGGVAMSLATRSKFQARAERLAA